jgi:hybrid cluster-associated redox disulfide protein
LRSSVTVEYQGSRRSWVRKETAIFTKDMSMMEALQADPRARDVFAAHGMGCVGCMGVSVETIEDGARMHGIDPDIVVGELNKLEPLPEERPG